jgi:hypothetical protein
MVDDDILRSNGPVWMRGSSVFWLSSNEYCVIAFEKDVHFVILTMVECGGRVVQSGSR